MSARIVLHPEHQIGPVVLTQRLRVMEAVRVNLRRGQLARDGVLRPTPLLDASIERLEGLLALHLPSPKGGPL